MQSLTAGLDPFARAVACRETLCDNRYAKRAQGESVDNGHT